MDDDFFSKLSIKYNDLPIFRALVVLAPSGGALDVMLSAKAQKIEQRRIEQTFEYLHHELLALADDKVNKTFLDSEECYDLIVKTVKAARETRQNDKLRLYARIVKSALNTDKVYEEGDPELFLQIISELTPNELEVSWLLFELKSKPIENYEGNDAHMLSKNQTKYSREELIPIFLRLEKTGLIKELIGAYISNIGGRYEITSLFKKLIAYIETME